VEVSVVKNCLNEHRCQFLECPNFRRILRLKKAYVDLRCYRQTLKVTVGKQFCYRFSLLFLQSFPRKKWHAVAASLGKRYRENLSIFRIRAALALPVEDFGVFALHLSPHVAERNQQHSNSLGAHFCL